MKSLLKIACPKKITLLAYAYILFVYFPDGLNAKEITAKIGLMHENSQISYKSTLELMHNIRSYIMELVLFE